MIPLAIIYWQHASFWIFILHTWRLVMEEILVFDFYHYSIWSQLVHWIFNAETRLLCVVLQCTDLPEACQLPPGCSALRHRRMPGRNHPPVGTQRATAPDPRPGDPPQPGHGPETHQTIIIYSKTLHQGMKALLGFTDITEQQCCIDLITEI